MEKHSYFHNRARASWPPLEELAPYFLAQPDGSGWFHATGNDSAGLDLHGIDGTEHLPGWQGRKDIGLTMWGNPEFGILLQHSRYGGGEERQDWFSKGDMSRIREWTRSLHNTPLPIGLFIPFPKAWLAVKEFMETEGKLPSSIAWVNAFDLPSNSFPDPTEVLPGETE